jgi:hypothetical protein
MPPTPQGNFLNFKSTRGQCIYLSKFYLRQVVCELLDDRKHYALLSNDIVANRHNLNKNHNKVKTAIKMATKLVKDIKLGLHDDGLCEWSQLSAEPKISLKGAAAAAYTKALMLALKTQAGIKSLGESAWYYTNVASMWPTDDPPDTSLRIEELPEPVEERQLSDSALAGMVYHAVFNADSTIPATWTDHNEIESIFTQYMQMNIHYWRNRGNTNCEFFCTLLLHRCVSVPCWS